MVEKVVGVVSGNNNGDRFDKAAAEIFPQLSRKKIKQIIDKGGAYLNKHRLVLAGKLLKTNDKIELFWDEKIATSDFTCMSDAWKSIFAECIIDEQSDYVVINKPAGIAAQATLTSQSDTIIHALSLFFPQKFSVESLYLVHRLDKDTSGIMILARNKKTQQVLEECFRLHKAKKVYQALCFYIPKNKEGNILYPVIPCAGKRKNTWEPIFKTTNIPPGAKSAETRYVTSEVFTKCDASWITCFPKTGRTHQIRVHLMAIGCPILGDKTYSGNVLGHSLGQTALRQMLHAEQLSLPILSGEIKTWVAPLPPDFATCLEIMRQK